MGRCEDRPAWQEGGFLGTARALRSFPAGIGTAPVVRALILDRPTSSCLISGGTASRHTTGGPPRVTIRVGRQREGSWV